MSHGPTFYTDWRPYIALILSFIILSIFAPSVFSLDFWVFILLLFIVTAVIYVVLFYIIFKPRRYRPRKTFHHHGQRRYRGHKHHRYSSRRGNHYLIEFRFFGKAQADMKRLIWDVNKRFHIRPNFRPVPHISLVGPLSTRDERKLVDDFLNVCKKQDIMQFNVVGFNTFEENRVVFIDIKPDEKMEEFRKELSETLRPYCTLKPYDFQEKFNFHSTVAMNLNPKKFQQVKNYIGKKQEPSFKHVLVRVTIIKNQRILYEYDFMLRKMLNRQEAKSQVILSRTFSELKDYIEKKNEKL